MFRRDRLVEVIDAHVLTNDAAARELGVTAKTLQRWRSGESTPHRSNIHRMAQVFAREPRWFVEPEEMAA